MSAVSGLLSTTSAASNDLVGEFQESIFIRNSKGFNVGTTLFGLMARLKTESADNIEFNWFERDPVRKVIYANGAVSGTTNTALVVDDAAGASVWQILAAGHILRNDRTGEYYRVTADPANDTLTISRGFGASTAAAINDNDVITIITLAKDEGATASRGSYEDPSLLTNYVQTYNSTVELTNAFKGQVLRTDLDGPLKDRRIQALEKVSRDIEMSFLLGLKAKTAGTNGWIYSTGGILASLNSAGLTANVLTGGDSQDGTSTKLSTFNSWVQSYLTYGSDAKLVFCGPAAYAAFSSFANSAANGYRIMQNETVFGMHITVINTPYGELSLAYHPLLKEAIGFTGWMFAVDLAHLVQKTFEPLFLEPNIQTPGQDSYKEQYRAKLGLKLKFANAFGVAKNVTALALT